MSEDVATPKEPVAKLVEAARQPLTGLIGHLELALAELDAMRASWTHVGDVHVCVGTALTEAKRIELCFREALEAEKHQAQVLAQSLAATADNCVASDLFRAQIVAQVKTLCGEECKVPGTCRRWAGHPGLHYSDPKIAAMEDAAVIAKTGHAAIAEVRRQASTINRAIREAFACGVTREEIFNAILAGR